jgi:hypothetical protein
VIWFRRLTNTVNASMFPHEAARSLSDTEFADKYSKAGPDSFYMNGLKESTLFKGFGVLRRPGRNS